MSQPGQGKERCFRKIIERAWFAKHGVAMSACGKQWTPRDNGDNPEVAFGCCARYVWR
jgi:hypothetical protein